MLALESPNYFSQEQLQTVGTCISEFIITANADELREAEKEEWYIWQTFLPYIKLFYLPDLPSLLPDKEEEQRIQENSQLTIFVALENMLGCENHREFLKHEGLLDYITCLPWHKAGSLHERAKVLVNMIQQVPDVQLQPPSLLNMTKAVIARYYCGLEKVLQLNVPELLAELYYDN